MVASTISSIPGNALIGILSTSVAYYMIEYNSGADRFFIFMATFAVALWGACARCVACYATLSPAWHAHRACSLLSGVRVRSVGVHHHGGGVHRAHLPAGAAGESAPVNGRASPPPSIRSWVDGFVCSSRAARFRPASLR